MSVKHMVAKRKLTTAARRQLAADLGADIARLLEAQRAVGGNQTDLAAEMFGKWSAYTDETDVKGLIVLKAELERG